MTHLVCVEGWQLLLFDSHDVDGAERGGDVVLSIANDFPRFFLYFFEMKDMFLTIFFTSILEVLNCFELLFS